MMRRALLTGAAVCVMLFGFSAFAQAATISFGTNLIVDPGAESVVTCSTSGTSNGTPIPEWTLTSTFMAMCYNGAATGYPTPSSPGASGGGNSYFYGGYPGSNTDTASQTIDVSSISGQIDASAVAYTLSGMLGGYASQEDTMPVTATFLDGSGSTLGSATIGPVTAAERSNTTEFLPFATNGMLPTGTRSVQIMMTCQTSTPTSCDGYDDQLSFVVNSPAPSLAVNKTDNGPWQPGQSGAQYTIGVSNTGTLQTTGTITVTDSLPAGVTVASGFTQPSGWSCTATSGSSSFSCTSKPGTTLSAPSGSQAFTLPVSVAGGTASPVANTVAAYGGGDPNHPTAGSAATGSDSTTINPAPLLTVTKTATNTPWTIGQANSQYTITINNAGNSATSGNITVTDDLPSGLTTSSTGPGSPIVSGGPAQGSCTVSSGTQMNCSLTKAINAGSSVTITVPVAINPGAPNSATNTASAYGGGDLAHATSGTAATDSITTAIGVAAANDMVIGPESNPTASGSYDDVVSSSNLSDFTATAVQRGVTPVTNPDGGGTPLSVMLSAATAPCIPHTFEITGGGKKQISVTATAPRDWQVGLYSNATCTTLYGGSVVGNSTTGAIGDIKKNVNVEVYTQYTTSGAISITPFSRYDASLYAYQTGHSQSGNTTHDELFFGFIPVVKTQTIKTSTCSGGSGLCPGSILQYTLTYSNVMPSGYTSSEGSLTPRPFPYGLALSITDDGIAEGTWGTHGALTAAPTDTTSGTTFTYTKNGVSTGNPVGATAFTATIGGSGFSGLQPGASGTITFTVKVN